MKNVHFGIIIIIVIFSVSFTIIVTGPVCGNGQVEGRLPDPRLEECDDGNLENGDGCSDICRVEFPYRIYVSPYLGNIDGEFSEEWYFFYDQLADFYDREGIPVGATIFPASIVDKEEFAPYVQRLYESPYVELVQKANTGHGRELAIDNLSYSEQRSIIKVKNPEIRKILLQVREAEKSFKKVTYKHNPRTNPKIKLADTLVNRALDESQK